MTKTKKLPKSPVDIKLIKGGAFLTIGDGVTMTWTVSNKELILLGDKIEALRPELEERIAKARKEAP